MTTELLPADIRARAVQAARGMIGTPWHHQGRVPGPCGGVDCVGQLVCIGRVLGLEVRDEKVYGLSPDPGVLEAKLLENCDRIEPHEAGEADIVRMWLRRRDTAIHAGMLTGEGTIVHAFYSNGLGEVREDPFDRWRSHAVDFWRYRLWQASPSPPW